MLATTARVATERPTSYLKRLCEHFADDGQRHSAQRFEVTFDDHEGFIDFAPVVSGSCRLDARRQGVLVVEAGGTDRVALERVQRIVARHLERFGAQDGLRVEWSPASER
jgi:caffeoyl-CoA O-methyltransferase